MNNDTFKNFLNWKQVPESNESIIARLETAKEDLNLEYFLSESTSAFGSIEKTLHVFIRNTHLIFKRSLQGKYHVWHLLTPKN